MTVLRASASRVTPRCPHFGVCGGCTLQHAHPSLQIAAKQRALEDAFARIGRVRPGRMLPPIEGPAWRLPLPRAPVGAPCGEERRRAGRLPRAQVELRRRHDRVPRAAAQAVGPAAGAAHAHRSAVDARPPAADRSRRSARRDGAADLRAGAAHPRAADARRTRRSCVAFADAHGVEFWLQTGGPATVVPFYPRDSSLAYRCRSSR